MKCTAKLIYYKKLTPKGKKKLFTSLPYDWDLVEWSKILPDGAWKRIDWSDIHECGGKIVSEIMCYAEPTFGEEYETIPVMSVNFVCKNCGQYYHPNLPREETSLNEWLTDIIEKLP